MTPARRWARSWRARPPPTPTSWCRSPIPASGRDRLCAECGLPFELGIIRNHYVGRTFIQPTQSIRELGVRMKHNANRAVVEGKRVVLIDDSIVRGTISIKIMQMMRDAGAREVHFRISSPPIAHPDFYGIDTPSAQAARRPHGPRRRCVDSSAPTARLPLGRWHLSRHGLSRPQPRQPQFTDHCFTGDYPDPSRRPVRRSRPRSNCRFWPRRARRAAFRVGASRDADAFGQLVIARSDATWRSRGSQGYRGRPG